MARQSRFDKAVKGKVKDYQAEPSAKVWAGIRESVPGKPGPGRAFYARLVGALLIVGVGGLIWWSVSQNGTSNEEMGGKQLQQTTDATQNETANRAQDLSQDAPNKQEMAANEATADSEEENTSFDDATSNLTANRSTQTASFNNETAKKNTLKPGRQSGNTQEESKEDNSIDAQTEPNREITMEGISTTPEQLEEISSTPPQPTLQEIIAREDAQEKTGEVEAKADVEGESKTGRRRLNLRNMDRDEFRDRTGTVLGKVAQGAGDVLGIKTDVKESETDERKSREVTVKFGPFKIKRVKNKKR